MKRFLVVMLLGLLALQLRAQVMPETPSTCPAYLVVHGNGVRTTKVNAHLNSAALASKIGTSRNGYPVEHALAFARSGSDANAENLANDLIEAFVQWNGGQRTGWSSLMRWLRGALGQKSTTPPPTDVHAAVRALIEATRRAAIEAGGDSDVHVNQIYRPALLAGKRVVVVAHSQGTFFANEAYTRLSGQSDIGTAPRMRLVVAASPASFIAGNPGNTRYATAAVDWVIFPIPEALRANVPFTEAQADQAWNKDPTGHGFREIYLNPAFPTYARMMSLINEAFDDLPNNCYFVNVNPAGTYLNHPNASGPTTITLASISASPGSQLLVSRRGFYRYSVQGQTADSLGAMFTGFGDVPVGPGSSVSNFASLPYCGPPTWQESYETDVPHDFALWDTPAIATVPYGPFAIKFTTSDCYVNDNFVSGSSFGARIVVLPPNNQ